VKVIGLQEGGVEGLEGFEDPEHWEEEDDDEEEEDEEDMDEEDGIDDSEGLEMGDMPGHEIDIDLHFDHPQALGGRGVFGGIGGNAAAAVPTQVTPSLPRHQRWTIYAFLDQ
jgi:hypothetical protein